MWKKHDGSKQSPEPLDCLIEVETYSSNGNFTVKAASLDWQYVKFYRPLPEDSYWKNYYRDKDMENAD